MKNETKQQLDNCARLIMENALVYSGLMVPYLYDEKREAIKMDGATTDYGYKQ